jgi:mono/diheme cytochrome c family protein
MIAIYLISLSGCGGGSNGGVDATTVPTVQTTTKAPDTPAGVSAVGGTNKVAISWNAVSGATSYNLYWSTVAGGSTITGVRISNAGSSYIHRGLLPAATYYYIVTAQNSAGESSASGQVSVATAALDGTVPYNTYCANCHGPLATSFVNNAGITEIRAAMQNFNAMNSLPLTALTDSQIAAISAALTDGK